jgi:hypothetical protein
VSQEPVLFFRFHFSNHFVLSPKRLTVSVDQESSGCLSFSAVSLHVTWGIAIMAFPVFTVLVAIHVAIVVGISGSDSLSTSNRFVIPEIIEPSKRLSSLSSSGVIDLVYSVFIKILFLESSK